jgi:hypothetical protein
LENPIVTEPPKPWYQRSLLPPWLPEWLAVSVLIAVGFGICFALFLDTPSPWKTGLVATAIGFGLALLVLTLASAKSPKTPEGQRIAPPAVVRRPFLAGIATVIPLMWAINGQIDFTRGNLALKGPAVGIVGVLGLLVVAAGVALIVWDERRREGRIQPSGMLALAVAVGGLAWGVAAAIGR